MKIIKINKFLDWFKDFKQLKKLKANDNLITEIITQRNINYGQDNTRIRR